MGIGTDTYPHNFLEEMRNAANHARTIAGTVDDLETFDVFNAATTGGARALRRDDIGRLAVGAKADLVLVDLDHPSMMPVREPLRSLIYVAADPAVPHVYLEGIFVVESRKTPNKHQQAASPTHESAQKRSLEKVPDLDWAGRDANELAPMVLETRNEIC